MRRLSDETLLIWPEREQYALSGSDHCSRQSQQVRTGSSSPPAGVMIPEVALETQSSRPQRPKAMERGEEMTNDAERDIRRRQRGLSAHDEEDIKVTGTPRQVTFARSTYSVDREGDESTQSGLIINIDVIFNITC